MKKRDFLTMRDLSTPELVALISRARALKAGAGSGNRPLIGKSVGLIFEKSSTRTRVSFEAGVYQLGAQPIYLSSKEIQLGRGETVADTAKVLSRYMHAVAIRTFEHERILDFARNADIPVINALTDLHHPCQALADIMTIEERFGNCEGRRLAYIGDGNNVANSLIEAAARMGLRMAVACPKGYEPDSSVLETARAESRYPIEVVDDPRAAARGADVLYTDVWVSMGQENQGERKRKVFLPYQINSALLALAAPGAIVMHCLPAHRGEEIAHDVMDGPASVVFDQAENRLHAQKALMESLLSGGKP